VLDESRTATTGSADATTIRSPPSGWPSRAASASVVTWNPPTLSIAPVVRAVAPATVPPVRAAPVENGRNPTQQNPQRPAIVRTLHPGTHCRLSVSHLFGRTDTGTGSHGPSRVVVSFDAETTEAMKNVVSFW
jgi:hypothetical protein